jgi:hypothetical protein
MEGVVFTCRGFLTQYLWRALRTIGSNGEERKLLVGAAGRQAEAASQWLWGKREEKWARN